MIPLERLHVAERAHQLALRIYRATAAWPDRSLAMQIRRCAVSIPSNLAEGAARETQRDFARFVGIAHSSAAEAQYQLRLAHDLGFLPVETAAALQDETHQVRRMLGALLRTMRDREARGKR